MSWFNECPSSVGENPRMRKARVHPQLPAFLLDCGFSEDRHSSLKTCTITSRNAHGQAIQPESLVHSQVASVRWDPSHSQYPWHTIHTRTPQRVRTSKNRRPRSYSHRNIVSS
uniref:Uncharacterized protein n=1 Tax=Ulva partita TaxID=1605170 RepID=A0A1C9ZW79_9CHLO|nr:hypothetical protein [Ulva partita]